MSRNVSHRKNIRKKFCLLRIFVIVLSLISLISRVIYCTFATWLTITTFDCIPCPNISSRNGTSDLFTAHHSSAVFKTVRSLNIDSAVKRVERAYDLNDFKHLTDNDNDSNFANDYSNEDIKRLDDISGDQSYESVTIQNRSFEESSELNNSGEVISNLVVPETTDLVTDSMLNKSEEMSVFFGDDLSSDNFVVPSVHSSSNRSVVNGSDFERFTYIPGEELLNIVKNSTIPSDDEINDFESLQKTMNSKEFSNGSEGTILLNKGVLNTSKILPKKGQKSTKNRRFNQTYVAKNLMDVCSEDCAQFLNIELSDADVRKWATIVITGVLYLYAFVMFCIFISACMALVDLLVLSTFIEGAKLFAGFILIIIDSFNGLLFI